jgi:hypothetical protein
LPSSQKEATLALVTRDFGRWRLEGAAKGIEGVSLRVTFVGRDVMMNNYAQSLFAPGVLITREASGLSRIFPARPVNAEVDLWIRELSPWGELLPGKRRLHQSLIDTRIPLERGFDHWFNELIGTTLRNRYRKALSEGITTHRSNDIADLDWFHRDFLLPATNARHGERAFTPPLEFFRGIWRPGCFRYLRDREGKILYAEFIQMTRFSGWRFLRVAHASEIQNNKNLKSLTSTLLDAESIRDACEAGQTGLSMGLAPAFLTDGLLKHKREWGAQPVRAWPWHPWCEITAVSPVGERVISERKPFCVARGQIREMV